MTCEVVHLPGGGAGVVCSDAKRRRCAVCGELGASKLCDGPAPIGSRKKSCDRPLCARCAHHEEPDKDLCPECRHAVDACPLPLLEDPVRRRGGAPAHISGFLDLPPGSIPEAAEALAAARARAEQLPGPYVSSSLPPDRERPSGEEVDPHAPAANPGHPPQPAAGEGPSPAAAAAPADERARAAVRPAREPRQCRDCEARIFWAATLDDEGHRIRRDDGKGWKSMPVNAAPDPAGNVVLFTRPGEGIVARVLRRGEAPPPGAVLRTSHFANCPAAAQRRRPRSTR